MKKLLLCVMAMAIFSIMTVIPAIAGQSVSKVYRLSVTVPEHVVTPRLAKAKGPKIQSTLEITQSQERRFYSGQPIVVRTVTSR